MLPSKLFTKVELSAATRRPVLREDEIEVLIQDNVTLYDVEPSDAFADGILRLTTHQMIWVDQAYSKAVSLHHSKLDHVEPDRKYFISLKCVDGPPMRILFDSVHHRDKVLASLNNVLKQALWKVVVVKKEFSSQNAGISGLIRNNKKKLAQDERDVSDAFGDLDELVSKAEQLVKIARKFKAKQQKQEGEETKEVSSMMFEMGISSPITKASAGSLYHEELSRQIAEFLPELVAKTGGMMSLPDVYCIVNRARGTQLLSPEDLYRAVLLFSELELPLRYREFDSGVRVVELAAHSDSVTSESLLELARSLGHLSAHSVARRTGVSVTLAQEELLRAELDGVLCRDESLAGLLFYQNTYWPVAALVQ